MSARLTQQFHRQQTNPVIVTSALPKGVLVLVRSIRDLTGEPEGSVIERALAGAVESSQAKTGGFSPR